MQPKSFIEGGQVIFNLHLGMGHLFLCQMEKVGYVFSIHHIFKCSCPPHSHYTFDQSLCQRFHNFLTTLFQLTPGKLKYNHSGTWQLSLQEDRERLWTLISLNESYQKLTKISPKALPRKSNDMMCSIVFKNKN